MEQDMTKNIAHESVSNLNECRNVFCPPRSRNVSQKFSSEHLLELCNSFWVPSPCATQNVQPYLRGCKWSPDGTCCLSVVNQDGFHIMELPYNLYNGTPTHDRMITLLASVIHIKESGLVYDFCWYPKMNSHYPDTCSWISTKINSPIQMWDAYDGSLRCSYRGFSALDEMEPALSVTFIKNGQQIVGGYRGCLRTFDVERPGRDFIQHKIKNPAACFATSENLLAVGSWNTNISLFSILDNGTYKSVGNLHAHTGGITHLKFTPDGTKLVSGARKDHKLCVWDMRYYKRPLNILKRCVNTNQRIYFDISSCGRYLVSGGTDGVIRVWDNNITKWTEQFNIEHTNQDNATFRFRLHNDCCNSISIHPSRPILATGSGQFHVIDPVKALEFECDKSDNCAQTTKKSVCQQTLSENANILFIETHKTFINPNETHIININEMVKESHIIKPNHDATEKTSNMIAAEESNGEEPLAKKLRRDDDFNSISIDTEASLNPPDLETCKNIPNKDNIHEEQPNIKCKQHSTKQPFTEQTDSGKRVSDLANESKLKLLDKPTYQVRDDSLSQSANVCSVEINKSSSSEDSSHNKLIEHDTSETIIINNASVQSSINVTIYEELNQTSSKESCDASLPTMLSESNRSDKDNQFSARLTNLNRSSSMILRNCHVVKSIASTQVIDLTNDSDSDNNDINENEMKYSSYAENNLTFWWVGNIFDK